MREGRGGGWQLQEAQLGGFFEEGAGDEAGDGSEEPLYAPELDGLPVEGGAGGEEDSDGDCANQTEGAKQESDEGGRAQAKASAEGNQFAPAGDLGGAVNIVLGTAGAATMAVARADDEFGTALFTGLGADLGGDDFCSRRSPELILRLIDNP